MSELEPGRQLDNLIAEKVMGWKDICPAQEIELDEDHGTRSDGKTYPVPPYSTSIEAAWEIVEKLGEQGWYLQIGGPNKDHPEEPWSCRIKGWIPASPEIPSYFREFSRAGKTAPHCICLAALQAVNQQA